MIQLPVRNADSSLSFGRIDATGSTAFIPKNDLSLTTGRVDAIRLILGNSTDTFQTNVIITMDTLHKVSYWLCRLAGVICALWSIHFLFFAAAYNTAVVGIVFFGFAIAFATIAQVIKAQGHK